ncbi:hypothetical protein ACFYT4_17890 [Streptomyces sp. NPDC004609]|uniref:hypothetical protein n=1 Tax=Streptomyces sp. NPDC004609 TaxID=3364704 RepID=UPI0036937736
MSTATDYRAERRADHAAEAEQRRLDAVAADARRAERERVADERAARLREQQRAGRVERRAERAARRAQAWTPGNIYRTGTLALVVASGLASLPAQVLHFVHISPMLLPLPFALEGAAWVMAAGVAYADHRGLSAGVRWLLRGFVVAAAGFAASINYSYGTTLAGLSPAEARTAGLGLAAVTLLGPLLFEIRQWVSTLAASTGGPEDRERNKHTRRRRRHHRKVARIADRLMSAAPHGTLPAEDAWERAWTIVYGAGEPGMTPDLHRRAVKSAAALTAAQNPTQAARKGRKAVQTTVERSMSDLHQSTPDRPAVVPAESTPAPVPVDPAPVRAVAAVDSGPRRSTGRVPESARTARPARTPDQLLSEARSVTADWPDAALTAEAIRKAVRTSSANGRTLRDVLRAERDGNAVTGSRQSDVTVVAV